MGRDEQVGRKCGDCCKRRLDERHTVEASIIDSLENSSNSGDGEDGAGSNRDNDDDGTESESDNDCNRGRDKLVVANREWAVEPDASVDVPASPAALPAMPGE